MYTILDKHGNPVTDKDGNPIEHNGTYADDYAELRKQAPVTIIQHTPLPDEDGTTSYPVHIGTPDNKPTDAAKSPAIALSPSQWHYLPHHAAKRPQTTK
jgi:hypothetical protein